MCISWAFTGDGLLAFAGGALALIGVWWSNRQSIKNVEKQLEAERKARAEETERQKRAVATAILFEIDNFYRHHLGHVRDLLDAYARSKQLPTPVPASAHGFVVYHGNVSRLGDLHRELAGKIVRFYGMAEYYEVVGEDYRARVERGATQDQGLVETQFRQLRNFISKLELSAFELSKELCLYLDLPFDPGVVEIAGTDVKALEVEVAALDNVQAAAMQQISTYAKKD
jgi:hypothetical protein